MIDRLPLILLLFGIFLGGPAPASGQSSGEIASGILHKKIVTRADSNQSYALYLPTHYTPSRKWPLLFAFDPRARGDLPVECFQQAAEKYGYIVAGSNNSRNGPMAASSLAAQSVISDLSERFNLNEDRLYLTGFSGGGRAACSIGFSLKNQAAGVIGCGAGFPEDSPPSANTLFPYCGAIGAEDFNWIEMKILNRQLDAKGIPHQILHFEGGHNWPPPEIAVEAIEWMELQGMKTGRRPQDRELIQVLFQKSVSKAEALESAGSFSEALENFSHLAATFKGLMGVSEIETKITQLRQSKTVQNQVKKNLELEEYELREMSKIRGVLVRLSSMLDPMLSEEDESQEASLGKQISLLKLAIKNEKNLLLKQQSRRLLEYISMTAYYSAEPLLTRQEYSLALPYLQIQALVHPESAGVHFRIARVYALSGNKKKALTALKIAVEKGFSDAPLLENEKAFDPVREEPRFKEIVEAVKKNQSQH
jgi:dienelactone hydrolase